MATAVLLPRQGQSVESCVIGAWKKAPGDVVKTGDILFSYETDKSAFEEEAKVDGVLLAVFFGEGEDVPCLTTVAVIGERGEDISSFAPQSSAPEAEKEKQPAKPAAAFVQAPARATGISPRARAAAGRMKLDASAARPTGPHGRILERDVLALAGSRAGGPAQETANEAELSAFSPAPGGYRDEKMSFARRIIAKNMFESLQTMAQLTHTTSFDASGILALRAHLKALGDSQTAPTLNDMVLYVTARTLKACAYMNAHCLGDSLRFFERVHLGVAVDTPRGLIVPTLFNADEKSLFEIAAETRALALAARAGNISPDLLKGGTFTVSNLGAYGIEQFTPVINPPQVAILGVCCTAERVRTSGGKLETYPAMGLSLTYDHRAVDGAPASAFLQQLARALADFNTLPSQSS